MFTQCSQCETVFKLSADVLRAAGGQVRCGNCGEVFNALARLAEDANAFAISETSYDLESRADSILRAPAPPNAAPEEDASEDFGPPGVEIARLQILDWNESDTAEPTTEDLSPGDDEASADPSMEFTLPPGELDRIFVESKKKQAAKTQAAPVAPSPPAPAPAPAPADPEEFEVDIDPVPIQVKPQPTPPAPSPAKSPAPAAAVTAAVPAAAAASAAPAATTAPVAAKAAQATAVPLAPPKARVPAPTPTISSPPAVPPPATPAPAADEPPPHPESAASPSSSAFDVPDAVRFEILSGMESAEPLHELTRSSRTPGLRRWAVAAAAFGLLLAVQIVHHNREYLASHGPFAGLLRALYAGAGAPVPSAANLSAYQLRQWGVSGDPAADGTLRVRASILNSAAQLEAFPLLRVTLANRFGTSIGARDFEASEYLGKPTARYMNPGEQVDATMDILDPGKSAEGFEIDVCLRGADRKISCANDATPAQTKR